MKGKKRTRKTLLYLSKKDSVVAVNAVASERSYRSKPLFYGCRKKC